MKTSPKRIHALMAPVILGVSAALTYASFAASGPTPKFEFAVHATSLPFGATKVVTGDFNDDEFVDLAVNAVSSENNNISVLLGGPTGFHATPAIDVVPRVPGRSAEIKGIAAGDFDGNGIDDLAVTTPGSGVAVLLNQGGANFAPPAYYGQGVIWTQHDIITVNLNNDTKLDLVTTTHEGVWSLLGAGGGGFEPPIKIMSTAGINNSVVRAGDLNKDGKADLAVTAVDTTRPSNPHTVFISPGNGAGGFGVPFTLPVEGNFEMGLALADYNGDGDLDVAASLNVHFPVPNLGVELFLGDGAGGFTRRPKTDLPATGALAAGDLNGDGRADLVVAAPNRGWAYMLLGDSAGGFRVQDLTSGVDALFGVTIADLDGDLDLDVILPDFDFRSANVFIGTNTGALNFPPTANAGPDQTVEYAGPRTTVLLDGSASSDPDNDVLTYVWREGDTVLGAEKQNTLPVQLAYGAHTLTLTVSDGRGEAATDTVTVTVADRTPPALAVPDDIVVPTDVGKNFATVNPGIATATDLRDGAIVPVPTRSDNQPLNATYPLGATTITWKATDAAGNSTVKAQTITVEDREAPILTVPVEITVGTDAGKNFATVNPGIATATDNCDSSVSPTASRSDNQPLNATYPLGTTTITWKAVDAAGNPAVKTQTVTVEDREAPTLTSLSVDKPELWPPDHRMVDIAVAYTVSDNADANPTVTLSVTSNEPDNGLGDGDTAGDIVIVDSHRVRLRAERSSQGTGRVYTITVTCTDSAGKQSVETITVKVPKSRGQK